MVYSARVRLGKEIMRVGKQDAPLTAGMSVRVEVITDKRKVISYFLRPLRRHVQESLTEG